MSRKPRLRKRYIGVTDHALIRFLQRAGGVEVELLRAQLAVTLNRARNAAATIEAERYHIVVDGLVFVVRNDTVVTVLPEGAQRASTAS